MCFKCSFILLIIHVLFSICTYFFLKFFMPLPRSKNTWGRCGGPGPSHVICIYIAYCSCYVGVYCTPYILSGGLEYIISLLQTLVLTGTGFFSSYMFPYRYVVIILSWIFMMSMVLSVILLEKYHLAPQPHNGFHSGLTLIISTPAEPQFSHSAQKDHQPPLGSTTLTSTHEHTKNENSREM